MERSPAGYVPFDVARLSQADQLRTVVPRLSGQVRAWQEQGLLSGPGPIMVGIGASLAAACAPIWVLRQRGVLAWRLGAGDAPLPYPASDNPVILISQSGRSAETLEVLEALGQATSLAVINQSPSPISDLVPASLDLGNLPDSYASTLGYTATVAALGLIADAWSEGEIGSDWLDLADQVGALEASMAGPLQQAVDLFEGAHWADFVGAAPSAGSAEAAALLLREVARLAATGMNTRQYLHGALESVGGGVHVLFGDRREVELAVALAVAGYRVVIITAADVPSHELLAALRLPECRPAQRAILEACVFQALAGGVAKARGIDIEELVFHQADIKIATPAAAS